jgi:hypothetical protein
MSQGYLDYMFQLMSEPPSCQIQEYLYIPLWARFKSKTNNIFTAVSVGLSWQALHAFTGNFQYIKLLLLIYYYNCINYIHIIK